MPHKPEDTGEKRGETSRLPFSRTQRKGGEGGFSLSYFTEKRGGEERGGGYFFSFHPSSGKCKKEGRRALYSLNEGEKRGKGEIPPYSSQRKRTKRGKGKRKQHLYLLGGERK